MLSLRRLLPESLAERVRWWMRRCPYAVWPGSVGVPGVVVGVYCYFYGSERSTIVHVHFEDDSPMVEERLWI
jgi:hypothetical protein